jgi:hypothetical protein
MHTSYRAVDAIRRARYHRPEAQRPIDRKKDKDRYRRPRTDRAYRRG